MYSKIEGTAQNTHHNRSIVQYGVYERTKSTTNLCTGRTAVIRRIRHSDMFCCSTAAEIGSSPPCRTQKAAFPVGMPVVCGVILIIADAEERSQICVQDFKLFS